MKLVIEIELGNDSMVRGADAALALQLVAGRIQSFDEDELAAEQHLGRRKIRDQNGNSVGFWEVKR